MRVGWLPLSWLAHQTKHKTVRAWLQKPPCVKSVPQVWLNPIHIQCVKILEATRIISKIQDASSGAHELHEFKNRSRELQNSQSLAAEELHLESHVGSSNGLTQARHHNNKRV